MKIIASLLFFSFLLMSTGACQMKQDYDNPEAEARFQQALDYHFARKGLNQDVVKARKLYLEARDLGSTKALINLADMSEEYSEELGLSDDEYYCHYLKYSQEAAEKGRPEGYVNLYAIYYNGDCVRADKKKAMEFLHKAADMGLGSAMFRLGEIAEKKDYRSPEATEWYEKALQQGYGKAALELFGQYASRDLKKATNYLREGAKLGDKEVIYMLYALYRDGDKGYSFKKNTKLSNCLKEVEEEASKNWNEISDIPGITFPDLDERCPPNMKDN